MKLPFNPLSLLLIVLSFIRGISSKWYYALLYFALIPIYTWIYVQLPGEFYHANVSREPMVYKDEERISKELQKEIVDTFQSNFKEKTVVNDWSIDAKDFRVLFLKATDKGTEVEIRFKLAAKLTDTSHQRGSLFIDPTITFFAKEGYESSSGNDGEDDSKKVRYKPVKVDIPDVPFWNKQENHRFAKAFFPTQSASVTQSENGAGQDDSPTSLPNVTMPISKRLDDEILNLGNGIQGDPSKLSGHYERMFYLSAVTITTLGYGDISPLTTRARLWISSEAIFGIVVIGLFLNALSRAKPNATSSAFLS